MSGGKRGKALRRADISIKAQRRFWSKVEVVPGYCWHWKGYESQRGYGVASVDGKHLLAHRVAYVLGVGDIPARMDVHHEQGYGCDGGTCCNPDHLSLMDRSGNVAESNRRNGPRGNAIPLNARGCVPECETHHCKRCGEKAVVHASALVPPSRLRLSICIKCGAVYDNDPERPQRTKKRKKQ